MFSFHPCGDGDDACTNNYDSLKSDQKEYIDACLSLSMLVGLFFWLVSLLKLSAVSVLLSTPVLSGIMSSGGILIALSQIGKLFQVSLPSGVPSYEIVYELFRNLHKTNGWSFGIGIFCVLAIVGLRKLNVWINIKYKMNLKLPHHAIVMMFTIVLSYAMDLENDPYNVNTVGSIPSSLPPLTLPSFPKAGSLIQVCVCVLCMYAMCVLCMYAMCVLCVCIACASHWHCRVAVVVVSAEGAFSEEQHADELGPGAVCVGLCEHRSVVLLRVSSLWISFKISPLR